MKGRGILTYLFVSRAARFHLRLVAFHLLCMTLHPRFGIHRSVTALKNLSSSGVCEALLVSPSVRTPTRGRRSGSHLPGSRWRHHAASSSSSSSASDLTLSREEAAEEIRRGAAAFRRGNVQESLEHFDRVDALRPDLRPYLWQRGLGLYYADRFAEASEQFHIDVRVNPYDVEEIVWDVAAQARLLGPSVAFPPPGAMSVPDLRRDRRRIMPTIYKLFKGQATEQDLFVAGHEAASSAADEFYSLLYLGLYCEVRGETGKASHYLKQSLRTSYAEGRGQDDYMTAVARVHCQLRGWV